MPELFVGTFLPHLDKAQLLQDSSHFSSLQDGIFSHS